MDFFETYVRELSEIRASGAGTPEPSFYPALQNLLNGVGRTLNPSVRCIMNLRDLGAGFPDGGLFTADQTSRDRDSGPASPQIPSRGAIEVKPVRDDAWVTAETEQVSRYWQRYRQVLVTNFRDFLLIGEDEAGRPQIVDVYRLADSEAAFWAAAHNRRRFAADVGAPFIDFLKRVMLHAAPLTTPRDVAWLLAQHAREAKQRIEQARMPELDMVRQALGDALGLTFRGTEGDQFFRSTLVQTLFYGIFSAWVLWSKESLPAGGERFNWREAGWYLRVPLISSLFNHIANPSHLRALGLVDVLERAGQTLNRVDRTAFFADFDEGQAVQYFYEPFLREYDPALREQLGVWYTPPEIVEYMVTRVETVLREELGIEHGLADDRVYVLDPCCGTGTYLLEVMRRIADTLRARGEGALLGYELKRATTQRIFGFEILPAPFVVAHLQMGLFLQQVSAPLSHEGGERIPVFLTNALTEGEAETQPRLPFSEFELERDAAGHVKREVPIVVVLGNPPYNGYAGIEGMSDERALSEAYRTTRRAPAPQGQGLNDLYVRFFRMAERRIVERSHEGIVCFISNYSWLDGLSYTGMRERYLDEFDHIWIDNLNGDRYKTGKRTPDGRPDPSVFSSEWNREGIQVGTAIALLVRQREHNSTEIVHFRSLWGANKRRELLDSLDGNLQASYEDLKPSPSLGFPYAPTAVAHAYSSWPTLPELFPTSFPGVKTSRDDVVVDIDREQLIQRMEHYFNQGVSHERMQVIAPGSMESTQSFNAERVRDALRRRGLLRSNIVRYCYRPFDVRWIYWDCEAGLLDRCRPEYMPHVVPANVWISAGQRNRKADFYQPQVTNFIADHHIVESNVAMFPLYLAQVTQLALIDERTEGLVTPNISPMARNYLSELWAAPTELFYHCIAVLHAPAYGSQNAGALRQDWPRVPLPLDGETLRASAELGRRVSVLLDVEKPVAGVTSAPILPELFRIGTINRDGATPINPQTDLAVTAGWGHRTPAGATMPGNGRVVERPYTPAERENLLAAAQRFDISPETL